MIDMHCHIIYNVDDGAPDEAASRGILDMMAKEGITDVIATPHYRRHMFSHPIGRIEENYRNLAEYARTIGINLYLGCEYHMDHEIFSNIASGRVHTMADSEYVLLEGRDSDDVSRIVEYVQETLMRGYRPIVAHVERFEFCRRDPDLVYDIIDAGGQIQITAGSVIGQDGRVYKKTAKRWLERDLVDYISSDCHNLTDRKPCMKACWDHVVKKYGQERADRLFIRNAAQIIKK